MIFAQYKEAALELNKLYRQPLCLYYEVIFWKFPTSLHVEHDTGVA